MADSYWGKIEFPAALIDAEVTKVLVEFEGVEMDNLDPLCDSKTTRPGLKTAFSPGKIRTPGMVSSKSWKPLEAKGIPFDRESGQAYEFFPELVIFRPLAMTISAPALTYLSPGGSCDKPGLSFRRISRT